MTNEAKVILTAEDRTRAAINSAKSSLLELHAAAVRIAPALAGIGTALGAGAFAGMVKNVADVADGLSKLSQKTGLTTESLSKLRYAASLSDVSNEQLETGLARLAKSMGEAITGTGPAAEAFQALGVSVVDSAGNLCSTEDVLNDLATAFAQSADGPERAAVAMRIFGKSGTQLIPLLNSGADGLRSMGEEAQKFGLVISGDLGKQSEAFNDNLTRLQAQLEGLKIVAGSELLPILSQLSGELVKNGSATDTFSTALGGIKTIFQTVVVLGANVAYVIRQTGIEIGGMVAQLAALARGDFQAFRDIGRMMKEDAAAARKEVDEFSDRILNPEKYKAATAAATETAGSLKKINLTASEIASQGAKALQASLTEALKQSKAEAKALEDQIKSLQKQAGEIKGVGTDAGKEAQARRDKGLPPDVVDTRKQREAQAAIDDARFQALSAQNAQIDGRAEDAQRYAEKAASLIKTASETAKSIGDDTSAAKLLDQVAAVAKINEQAFNALAAGKQTQLDEANSQIQSLEGRLNALKNTQLKVSADTAQADTALDGTKSRIDALPSEKTVTIKTVVDGPPLPAGDTVIPAQANAAGGLIRGPGSGTSDSILSWLSNGEYVIKADAVRHWGTSFFHALNNLTMPRFAVGGLVGRSVAAEVSNSVGRDALQPIRLAVPGVGEFPLMAKQDVATEMERILNREALAHGRRR